MNRFATSTLAFVLSVLTATAQAQAIITTVAGGGPNNMLALDANLDSPREVAVDSTGNQYIVAQYQHRIFKVDTAGQLTVAAGNGTPGFSGDGGLATGASLAWPSGVALDRVGNLYIADGGNQRIRRVDAASGRISTVAGNGTYGFSGDGGLATAASLAWSSGVAVDSGGNLYIVDGGNQRIRRVAPSGVITTVAGNGNYGFSGDGGLAIAASLAWPSGVALDSGGNLYIADAGNQRIRRVAPGGVITTVAGNGAGGFSGDGGLATAASLASLNGVAVDGGGNLYITDNQRIRRVDAATGVITTVAGNGSADFSGDGGLAAAASLYFPQGLALDSSGNLHIADTYNNRIRLVDADTGVITTVAGNGSYDFSGDGGLASAASLYSPNEVAVDSVGNSYIVDTNNYCIRRVDAATGVITTVAGNGMYGFGGDGGLATAASLASPYGVALDSVGNHHIADTGSHRIHRLGPTGSGFYIADAGNNRIRRVDAATGVISTVAGNGRDDFSGDGGLATAASLAWPSGVALDHRSNLYIADSGNQRIRRVDAATGVITTVAGNGIYGFSGDGGPATAASMASPHRLAVDRDGNLYIADTGNQRIRRVDATTGVITTVAGNGTYGFGGDGGVATAASLALPYEVAVDASGNLYIADTGNSRIRGIDAATGVITTVAGNPSYSFSGDGGLATAASLAWPSGVALDRRQRLYIADTFNSRIRVVMVAPVGAIDNLAGKIAESSLRPSIKTSMVARLSSAKAIVSDNNPNNDMAACGIIASMVNEITGMQKSGKQITDEANGLRQAADVARRTMGCR